MHVHTHTHTSAHVHARTGPHTKTHKHTHTHTHTTHTHTHAHKHTHTHTKKDTLKHTHTHTHTQRHKDTQRQSRTHTHTHKDTQRHTSPPIHTAAPARPLDRVTPIGPPPTINPPLASGCEVAQCLSYTCPHGFLHRPDHITGLCHMDLLLLSLGSSLSFFSFPKKNHEKHQLSVKV